MSNVEFVVEDTFDVPGRAGLLVGGRLSGEIQQGTILRDRRGAEARVLGVEFGSASMTDAVRAALLLAPDHGLDLTPGSLLVGAQTAFLGRTSIKRNARPRPDTGPA